MSLFKVAINNMVQRRLRSVLTLVGIIIGIAAIVSIITISQGLENSIESQLNSIGSDILFIRAKGAALSAGLSTDSVLNENDLKEVERTNGVKEVSAYSYNSGQVSFNGITKYFYAAGMPTENDRLPLVKRATTYTLLKGRWFEQGDTNRVMLNYDYSTTKLFDKAVEIGDKITVEGQKFTVIGFFDQIGNSVDDSLVWLPYETYRELYGLGDNHGIILASVTPGENINVVSERISKNLCKHRGLEEGKEDFEVETPSELAAGFDTILSIVNTVVVGLASISLLVGSVGIMNTMFTTVLQRTREIGIMKALGARRKNILTLFMFESGTYGLVGGIIGVITGLAFALFVEAFFAQFLGPRWLLIEINPWFILGALLFSFLLGCISGLVPAIQAAKMDPVDSLRYE